MRAHRAGAPDMWEDRKDGVDRPLIYVVPIVFDGACCTAAIHNVNVDVRPCADTFNRE